MTLSADIRNMFKAWRTGGVWYALTLVASTIAWRYYPPMRRWAERFREMQRRDEDWDRQAGVETCGDQSLADSGVPQHEVRRGNTTYRPVDCELFAEALSHMAIDYTRYAFIDYGSGKGKALLLASEYPFEEIVGIEYAPLLHEVAQRNLQRYRSPTQRCRRLAAILGDALEFEPLAKHLVCFFYNPFDDATLDRVLDRLIELWKAHPRHILLVYVNARTVKEKIHVFRRHSMLDKLHVGSHVATFGLGSPPVLR